MRDGGACGIEGGGGGRVAVVGRVDLGRVHGAAADEGALAGCEADFGEQVGGGGVDGGVVGGCGGAVAKGGLHAGAVDVTSFGEVG